LNEESGEESKQAMDCTEMISKMDKQRKWKNVKNEEGRNNYRELKKELKRATG
jgi:hypothetical protein